MTVGSGSKQYIPALYQGRLLGYNERVGRSGTSIQRCPEANRGMLNVKVCIPSYIMTALGLMVSRVLISVISESYFKQAGPLQTADPSTVC